MTALMFEHLVSSSVVALLAGIACFALRRRPALCHAVWVLVLIKLMAPPMVSWPWSPSMLFEAQRDASSPVTVEVDQRTSAAPRELRLHGNMMAPLPATAAPFPWRRAAMWTGLGLWLAGASVVAGVQAVRLRRLRRVQKDAECAPEWLVDQARDLANRFRMPSPEILVVDGINCALSTHLVHPRILCSL